MSENHLILHGHYLGNGEKAAPLSWGDVSSNAIANHKYWIHMDANREPVQDWLKNESGIDSQIVEIMLSKHARARFLKGDKGLLVVLKALTPKSNNFPDDLVSIRIYVEKDRIISVCRKNTLFFPVLEEKLAHNGASTSPFRVLIQMASELFLNLEAVIEELDDEIDKMDHLMNTREGIKENLVPSLSQIRSQTIILKSYLTPQKEVLHELMNSHLDWFEKKSTPPFANFSEKISLYLENLEVIKERSVVILDEIRTRNIEKTNRNSYIFSCVAVIFLPLSFLTGLFGINLAGIPGASNPWAFSLFSAGMVALFLGLFLFLRRAKWI